MIAFSMLVKSGNSSSSAKARWRFSAGVLVVVFLFAAAKDWAQDTMPKDTVAAVDKNDPVAAERHYRESLRSTPESAETYTGLGVALAMQDRSEEAIAAFRQALKLKRTKLTYAMMARELCRQDDLDQAKPMLKQILIEDATEPNLIAVDAQCYLDADLPIGAVQAFAILAEVPAYHTARTLVQLTRSYIAAAAYFGPLMNRRPDSAQYAQAIQQAQATGSTDGRAAFSLAEKSSPYFRSDASFSQALATWQKHPDDTALLYQMSVLSSEEAFKTFQQCTELFPESPYLVQFQAELLARQNREDEAIAALEGLEQQHAMVPDLWYNLGMLHLHHGDWEKAAEALRRQIAYAPRDEHSVLMLSDALLHLERYDEVKDLLASRARSNAPARWVSLDLATAEQKTGNNRGAIKHLLQAEGSDPNDRGVHYRLMRLYSAEGEKEAAERESQAFQKLTR